MSRVENEDKGKLPTKRMGLLCNDGPKARLMVGGWRLELWDGVEMGRRDEVERTEVSSVVWMLVGVL